MARRRSRDDLAVAGFLRIDKPGGMTSHDVVARVRRAVDVHRVGHSGTLDPMATGLLLVGVGWATRLLRFTGETMKTYCAEVTFGQATDTMDAQGKVTAEAVMAVGEVELRDALKNFTGTITQLPPMVSAVKVGGEALYRKARRGEEVARMPRQVTISAIDLMGFGEGKATLKVCCSSGTYVRVLADDLGRALGGVAYLSGLRRISIGSHEVEDAIGLDPLFQYGRGALLPPLGLLPHVPRLVVGKAAADAVRHGRPLPVTDPVGPFFAVVQSKEEEPEGAEAKEEEASPAADIFLGVYSHLAGEDFAKAEMVVPELSIRLSSG